MIISREVVVHVRQGHQQPSKLSLWKLVESHFVSKESWHGKCKFRYERCNASLKKTIDLQPTEEPQDTDWRQSYGRKEQQDARNCWRGTRMVGTGRPSSQTRQFLLWNDRVNARGYLEAAAKYTKVERFYHPASVIVRWGGVIRWHNILAFLWKWGENSCHQLQCDILEKVVKLLLPACSRGSTGSFTRTLLPHTRQVQNKAGWKALYPSSSLLSIGLPEAPTWIH